MSVYILTWKPDKNVTISKVVSEFMQKSAELKQDSCKFFKETVRWGLKTRKQNVWLPTDTSQKNFEKMWAEFSTAEFLCVWELEE